LRSLAFAKQQSQASPAAGKPGGAGSRSQEAAADSRGRELAVGGEGLDGEGEKVIRVAKQKGRLITLINALSRIKARPAHRDIPGIHTLVPCASISKLVP